MLLLLVNAPTQEISPLGTSSAEIFGSAALSSVAQLSPSGIGSAEALGEPTVDFTADIVASGIISEEAFGTPYLSRFQEKISMTANIFRLVSYSAKIHTSISIDAEIPA